MHCSWWLLSAAVLVVSTGCMEAPVEHTVRKVATEDVRRDTEKAVDTAARAATQAKEDFESRLKAGLAEMEEKTERLHEKGRALKDEAKTRWNEKMAELEAKQKVARDKLDELRTSTGEAWGHVEKGAQAAWDDVRKAFQEAAKEF
jgi:chromosome segregation ATPase